MKSRIPVFSVLGNAGPLTGAQTVNRHQVNESVVSGLVFDTLLSREHV